MVCRERLRGLLVVTFALLIASALPSRADHAVLHVGPGYETALYGVGSVGAGCPVSDANAQAIVDAHMLRARLVNAKNVAHAWMLHAHVSCMPPEDRQPGVYTATAKFYCASWPNGLEFSGGPGGYGRTGSKVWRDAVTESLEDVTDRAITAYLKANVGQDGPPHPICPPQSG